DVRLSIRHVGGSEPYARRVETGRLSLTATRARTCSSAHDARLYRDCEEACRSAAHSRRVRRSCLLSDGGLRRSTVRMMTTKSRTATGQWNQILCGLLKRLIRIRKPA